MPIELPADHHPLNSDEQETLLLMLREGLTNPELAERLSLSTAGVASRLHRLYARTGLRNRTDAVLWASKHEECCLSG